MTTANREPRRITAPWVRAQKGKRKIAALTAYDVPSARLADEAGVEILLVGDSLGPTVLGYENTLPVTLDEMIHHARAVCRAARRALVVGDLPFGAYHARPEDAVASAVRFVKEGGVAAVKLEGGRERAGEVRRVVEAGVPVMAHIGLLPQSVHRMGGFKVQGRGAEEARRLVEDALAVEEAGAFSVVLEGIPAALGEEITRRLSIPTIGIGAGGGCDGQILVFTDVVGLTFGHVPKFVRRYADVATVVREGLAAYVEDVREGRFPSADEAYGD